jgi:hypothetical protein
MKVGRQRAARALAALLLLGSTGAAAQEGDAGAAQGAAVARVVQGIISYTYWPSQPHILQFCIVGATRYRPQLLSDLRGTPGRPLQPRLIQRAYAPLMRGCDILYFSADTPATRQALQGIDRAALTISERDPACRDGAMFCLRIDTRTVSFDLNLDAVTRSGLRVDPKVLMLGRAGATP